MRPSSAVVRGLGFAAARDLGAFLKAEAKDDVGSDNPVFIRDAKTIVMGSSQSGRFVPTFIHLGFNRDERGQIVFDGAFPHIGGGLMSLNIRFGQPGRAAEQVDRLYPGASFPFTYGSETDPLTGARGGILDRCTATSTCPKIVHAATALEMWELRQSLGFTDPLGTRDLIEPPNVRSYIMALTQHGAAPLPLAAREAIRLLPAAAESKSAHLDGAPLQNLAAWIKGGTEHRQVHDRPSRRALWWRPIKCISPQYRPTDTATFLDRPCVSCASTTPCIRRTMARISIPSRMDSARAGKLRSVRPHDGRADHDGRSEAYLLKMRPALWPRPSAME
jgi:Alpha/beta hydrolase domain